MSDAINPSHYKDGWSDDAELISVTENLTGNGAQAVQYIARSTRIDGSFNKGDVIEDLEKAAWFIARELKRVRADLAAKEKLKRSRQAERNANPGFLNVNIQDLDTAFNQRKLQNIQYVPGVGW